MSPEFKVLEVNSPAMEEAFLRLPLMIYKDDPNWIRPLDQDIRDVFDPKKNKYFRHGEAARWILRDPQGCFHQPAFGKKIRLSGGRYGLF